MNDEEVYNYRSINVGFRIDEKLLDKCRIETERREISFSRFIREALREKLTQTDKMLISRIPQGKQ